VAAVIRVVIVDDHPVVLEGLASVLEADPDFRVVDRLQTGEAALASAPQLHPDVVIVDVRLPGIDGFQTCAQLHGHHHTRVVLVTSTPNALGLRTGFAAGCSAYVGKSAPPDVIREAVRCAAAGRRFVDPVLRHLTAAGAQPPVPRLAPADRRLLALVARGDTNAEIAKELSLSYGTVKNRVSSLLARLGAHRRADLVATASRLGLFDAYPADAPLPIAQPRQPNVVEATPRFTGRPP
jgi:DNA-binding NarL/FixJ family response regulator